MNLFMTLLSASNATPEINFQPEKFLDMLPYMGKGMLVIFVIIGVIILATIAISKLFSRKK